ncbi:MAG: CoA transferase [Betaproteobacteria bacterium]|nr:CoA transferase [Pseudomonadota bacterium]NBP09669.1 CoA transferase [Betaproteobacteria bacterium]NBQ08408.1 CoA transferase [Betaproteobacteria bacterium]NCV26317.1 CoA transferase [Betaproteobacteria bacterium]NCV54854.1 CoA transferase [Betaproteobacteria bacterium]
MAGPLSHIRVLDLSRVLAGPFAGQNMADLGAEVIKVERPIKGDDSRAFGPPYLADQQGLPTSESAYFLAANRGKKSITIDLSKPQGQELVRKLVASCDVLIENYKFGDLERYGLGYDALHACHPSLIYCSVTGFGHTGPYRERPGYDFMVQGMSGLMSVTGHADGQAGAGPMRVGVPIIDILTGMYASLAICAALAQREKTGLGQHIDMALLDTAMAFLSIQGMSYLTTGKAPGRIGNTHPTIVPYQVFSTADGAVVLACGNDNLFQKFCKAAGCEALLADSRFSTNALRVEHREALDALLNERFRQQTTKHWVALLEQAGVPNGPINSIHEAFEEEQVKARGVRLELPHPVAGSVPQIASPMRFSETALDHQRPPPTLGEHSDAILASLGLSPAQIAELRAQAVI